MMTGRKDPDRTPETDLARAALGDSARLRDGSRLAFLDRYADLGVLLVRLAFGARLIQGTRDNVFSWEHMLLFRDFLDHHGFPAPLVCAITSVAFQFACGILWILGWKTRWAGLFMAGNFTVALLGAHIGDPYLALAPALHLLVVALFLLAHGPGRISLDCWLVARAQTSGH